MDIIIEGEKIETLEELHLFLKESLAFPEYYGMNLDALWDMLTCWVELPLTISWKNYQLSEKILGESASRLMDLFEDAEKELEGFIIKKL